MNQKGLLDQLIQALCCLPGVGTKSAQRMAYELLERKREAGKDLGEVLLNAMANIKHCQQCKNFTELELCYICSNSKRDHKTICIVESPADVSAIENAAAFSGTYFVLMGHLSPLDGIGPEELELDRLLTRLTREGTEEIILATGSTMEGEATAHYIRDMVEPMGIKVSRIAQGVPMGGELEYIDSGTLARSISERRLID